MRSVQGKKASTGDESAVRVLIADDHPLMVGGLRQAVLAAAPGAEIAVAHDFDGMVAALDASPDTDLVLLDLTMPGVRGFSGLLFLRARAARPSRSSSCRAMKSARSSAIAWNSAPPALSRKPTRLDTMRAAIRTRFSTAADGPRPIST